MKWTAALVLDALREAYAIDVANPAASEWSMLTEVPLRDGRNERYADALLSRNWLSGIGFRRIAVEVKVSRSDYRNETPTKRAPAEVSAQQTVYAAPAGLIAPKTLPEGWGLIEVYDTVGAAMRGPGQPVGKYNSRCQWRVKAALRTPSCDLNHLASELLRRAAASEERIRRATDGADRVPGLEAEVERLAGMLGRRDAALNRERSRLREALSRLAAVEGMHECADCGNAVRWDPVRDAFEHVEKAHTLPCLRARQDAVMTERQAATGTAYLRGAAGPVEPRAIREALSRVHSDA